MRKYIILLIIIAYSTNIYAYEVGRTGNGSIIHWLAGGEIYFINANGGPVGSLNAIQAAAQTWSDVSTSFFIFVYGGTTSSSSYGINDGINIVSFGPLAAGTLGLNNVWYNPNSGAIYDSDIRFNTIYLWGVDGTSGVLDVQNVATHEFGHSLYLNDLYDITDTEKTMYGYSSYGQTIKRTLHQDDIDGISYIYPQYIQYTLTMAANPVGGGTTTPSVGSYNYDANTIVSITATPASGYRFVNWTGDVANPNNASTTVTMNGNKTLMANFEVIPQYILTMAVSPVGGGTTTPAAGSYNYNSNTIVSITATPASGYKFVNWTGGVAVSSSASTTVTMNANKTITANLYIVSSFGSFIPLFIRYVLDCF